MLWVALTEMVIGGKVRKPGSLVPEAADWRRTIDSMIARGQIAEFTEDAAARFVAEYSAKQQKRPLKTAQMHGLSHRPVKSKRSAS